MDIRKRFTKTLGMLLVITMLFAAMPATKALADTSVAYNAIPETLPPSMPSVGFQATQTSEFGDYIHLAGADRDLQSVTVTMVTWALNSTFPAMGLTGWVHPITLNVYNVTLGTPNLLGSLIVSKTQDFVIPWRPESDPDCDGEKWQAEDGSCNSGFAFNITFDLAELDVTLPDDVIVSIAYNTQTYGSTPIGVGGPYNSLNVGVEGLTDVGTDDNPDNVFWNTSTAAWYTDGGAAGVGIFREDTNWIPYGTLPVRIEVVAPASVLYVDQNWVGIPEGQDPDGEGPALKLGYDAFATIQPAIDAAAEGATINVAPGTYESFSVAGKSGLAIVGAGSSQTFIAPSSLIETGVGHKYTADMKAVIFVNASTDVSLQGMTFQSTGDTPGAGGADAIVFWNASTGTIRDSAIEGLYTISGAQTGQGLAVDAGAGQITNLTLTNTDISGFQKNGVDIVDGNAATSNAGTITLNVDGGSISGAGATSTIAQNGIMFWNQGGGNLSGTIDGVTLTGFDYAPQSATASGFLNFGAGAAGSLSVTGCNFADNEIHIFDNEGDKVNLEDLLAGNTFDKTALVEGGSAIYGAIQPAVDDANADDIVTASVGTFVEEVLIDKPLTLKGQGRDTILQSPDKITQRFRGSYFPVLLIKDAENVTVEDLTVDGAGKGNANYKFVGVGLYNAGGTIQRIGIVNVEDTPFSGDQSGVGLYGAFDDGGRHLVSVQDITVEDFQKNGITFNSYENTPVIVDIVGNTVVGKGATDVIAQNGIQVSGYALTANIEDNVVSGIAYDNTNASTKWVATSILSFDANLTADGNRISGGHVGIYNIDGPATISNNVFSIEKVGLYAYGIIATDPPQAIPAGIDVGEADGRANQMDRQAALKVEIKDNELTFVGEDNSDTYGIEADAGYGPENLSVLIEGNIVDSFDYGIVVYKGTEDGGVFTDVTAIYNCLYNNSSFGLWTNDDSITVNAINNFWGHATGPYHPTLNPNGKGALVSENYVDFDPWSTACQKSVEKYESNFYFPLFIND